MRIYRRLTTTTTKMMYFVLLQTLFMVGMLVAEPSANDLVQAASARNNADIIASMTK